MATCSFSIKSSMGFVACTVFILLTWMVILSDATAGDLHVTGSWQYSDSDAGASTDSQNYTASYTGRTDVTDLLKVSGSLRYTKLIRDSRNTDTISPTLLLRNANDLYSLSLTGSYDYQMQDQRPDNENWNWGSRLSSAWINKLWPVLSLYYGQNGSGSADVKTGSSDRAGFNTRWGYWQWLTLYYDLAWQGSDGYTGSSSESLKQNARLNVNKSFWDNRGRFNFSQSHDVNKTDNTSLITSGGYALVDDLTGLQVSWVYDDTPAINIDPSLLPDASHLFDDTDPATLQIDPDNIPKPMNLIFNISSQDVEVVRLYTTNDINSFLDYIDWELYESDTIAGTNYTLVTSGTLGPSNYDQALRRIEIDFGTVVNSEYMKLVLILPATTDVPPGEITDLDTVELFRKVFGTGSTITTSTEDETWRSSLGLGFQLSDTVSLTYNGQYSKREENNINERISIGNNASLSWSPSLYFQTRINVSDNRQKIENKEDYISRNYGFSISSEPLATLGVNAGFSRIESYTGSTLDRVINFYSMHASADLYRDLQATLDMSYTNPQEGGGTDSWGSTLYVTSRLSPALFLNWTSSYSQDLETSIYDFANTFRLNWRTSDFMYFNASLETDYGSDVDLATRLYLSMGVTPNIKHRVNLGYSIDDYDEDITQNISTTWSWVLTRVFNFRMAWNYRLADEKSWFLTGSLFARFL